MVMITASLAVVVPSTTVEAASVFVYISVTFGDPKITGVFCYKQVRCSSDAVPHDRENDY